MTENQAKQGYADFMEFCAIFDGVPFAKVEPIAKAIKLDFGADKSNELVDINFKTILATCVNKNGVSVVSTSVEFYNEDGERIFLGELKKPEERKTIDQLINLTNEQVELCSKMETLYLEMQKAGIAFAMNKKGYLVAYNALEIEDCELCMFGSDCKDYEEVDTNTLHDLFPFWDHCEMYLIRK